MSLRTIRARVEHERVVRVYDVGEHEGSLFVVMEFVPGTTLRQLMLQNVVGSPRYVLPIVLGIAEGLSVLHSRGVIHHDLKPENVMQSCPPFGP